MKEISQNVIQKSSDSADFEKASLKIGNSGTDQKKTPEKETLPVSIGREDITIIKGIGPSVALRLRENGINTIDKIANSIPSQIACIEGIGLASAGRFIENAKSIKKSKNLNNFTQEVVIASEIENLHNNDDHNHKEEYQEDLEYEASEDEMIDTERSSLCTLPEVSSIRTDISERDKKLDELNEDVLNYVKKNGEEPFDPNISKKLLDLNESKDTLEILHQNNISYPNVSKEYLNQEEIQELHRKVTKEIDLHEFLILKKFPEMRSVFYSIDLIGIKLVRVKEFLDLIYIIPIKICPLKGNLIFSNNKVEYLPLQGEVDDHQFNRLPESYLQGLSNSESKLFEDLLQEGKLLRFLSKYLQIDISLKKTLLHKNLFFHSGPVLYKILIEPLFISQNSVGFTERLIPFAYQKSTNIHITDLSQLSEFLQYIDQKYFLIETITDEETVFSIHMNSTNKFLRNLQVYSIPFILYGFILLSFLLLQSHLILLLLINFGYGILTIYAIMYTYFYFRYYKQSSILRHDFATPYYQKKRNFNETNLILINEELSPKLMRQFIYECVDINQDSKTILKLEEINAKEFLEKKTTEKAVIDSNLFEPNKNFSSDVKTDSKLRQNLIERYSSFLED
ncbi:MAG: helix-hairpin-helix domain-containing protein [Candidatus Thorarchaeota archaeon]